MNPTLPTMLPTTVNPCSHEYNNAVSSPPGRVFIQVYYFIFEFDSWRRGWWVLWLSIFVSTCPISASPYTNLLVDLNMTKLRSWGAVWVRRKTVMTRPSHGKMKHHPRFPQEAQTFFKKIADPHDARYLSFSSSWLEKIQSSRLLFEIYEHPSPLSFIISYPIISIILGCRPRPTRLRQSKFSHIQFNSSCRIRKEKKETSVLSRSLPFGVSFPHIISYSTTSDTMPEPSNAKILFSLTKMALMIGLAL